MYKKKHQEKSKYRKIQEPLDHNMVYEEFSYTPHTNTYKMETLNSTT